MSGLDLQLVLVDDDGAVGVDEESLLVGLIDRIGEGERIRCAV